MNVSDSITLQRLRQRMERLFAVGEIPLDVAGASRRWMLAMPADPDAPLDQLAAQLLTTRGVLPGQRAEPDETPEDVEDAAASARRSATSGGLLPYWALVWPSGLALAETLLAHPEALRDRRTLELGCGLGTTAIAALTAGASLWVADCFAETLLFCRYNALRNAGRQPRTLLLNWRTSAGRAACVARAPYDALLAADILYELDDLEPLLDLVPRLLAPGGTFWLAEPGRRVSRAFVQVATARGWRDETTAYERIWPTEAKPVRVVVHRYQLPR
ncbi:MAG TPA: methyltransferase domain-containing protein [Ktedonobacterales bacterium]|jgi:predicted nicotinamide N-methyase